jgi:hypothetical protein
MAFADIILADNGAGTFDVSLTATIVHSGTVDTTSTTTRTNLVPNPSFTTDLTGWSGAQPTERIAGIFKYGHHAMTSYCLNADTNMAYTTTATTTQTGNHIISVWVWVGSGSPLIGKTITLSVEGGTATVTPGASSPATLVNGWARASLVINVTGNGTVLWVARLSVAPNTLTPYTPMVIDGAMMELGSTLLPYFDGSFAEGYSPDSLSWSGTANNSSSTLVYKTSGKVHYSTRADPGDITRSTGATMATSPVPAATLGAIPRASGATAVTVAPTTAAAGFVTSFRTAPVTVTPTPSAAPAAMTKSATALCDVTIFVGTDLWTNTGVETDLTGWSGNTWGSISRVTTDAHEGTASALNTCTTFGPYGTTFDVGSVATPGRSYMATVWYKYLSGSVNYWEMYSIAGGVGPDLGAATGAWQQATYIMDTAQDTPVLNDIQMRYGTSATVGSTFLTDDFHLYDITRAIRPLANGALSSSRAVTDVTVSPSTAASATVDKASDVSLITSPTVFAAGGLEQAAAALDVVISPVAFAETYRAAEVALYFSRALFFIDDVGLGAGALPYFDDLLFLNRIQQGTVGLPAQTTVTTVTDAVGDLARVASADLVVSPVPAAALSDIADAATADLIVTTTPLATGTVDHRATAALTVTPTPAAVGDTTTPLKTGDALLTTVTTTPAAAATVTHLASTSLIISTAPLAGSVALKSATAAYDFGAAGGGGSPTIRPGTWTTGGIWVTPPPNPSPNWSTPVYGYLEFGEAGYIDMTFDTTSIPADATITSWRASITVLGDITDDGGFNTYSWALYEGTSTFRNGGTSSDSPGIEMYATVTPASWRSTALAYRITITNSDYDFRNGYYISEPKISVVYTAPGSGIITSATVGPKTAYGNASFVTATPSTQSALGSDTKSASASLTVTTTQISVPAPIVDQSTADLTTSPVPTAALGAKQSASGANGVTAIPTPLASLGANSKSTSASLAVSPVVTADSVVLKSATVSITTTPTVLAAAGAATKYGTADPVIVSTAVTAVPAPIIDQSTADTTSSTQTAASGTAVKTSSADLTTSPAVLASGTAVKTQSALGITDSPVAAAAGTATKFGSATVTITDTPAAAGSATKTTTAALTSTPVVSATSADMTKSTTAALVTSPAPLAAGAVSSTRSADAVTITTTPAATPQAMTKSASASLTVATETTATPSGYSLATDVDVTPVPAASGTVLKSTSAIAVTVTTTTVVDAQPIQDAATASLTVTTITTAAGTVAKSTTASLTVSPVPFVTVLHTVYGVVNAITVSPVPLSSPGAKTIGVAATLVTGSTSTSAAGTKSIPATAALTVSPVPAAQITADELDPSDPVTVSPLAQASGTVLKSSGASLAIAPVTAASAVRIALASADLITAIQTLSGSEKTSFGIADAYVQTQAAALSVLLILTEAHLLVTTEQAADLRGEQDFTGDAALLVVTTALATADRRGPERWGRLRL